MPSQEMEKEGHCGSNKNTEIKDTKTSLKQGTEGERKPESNKETVFTEETNRCTGTDKEDSGSFCEEVEADFVMVYKNNLDAEEEEDTAHNIGHEATVSDPKLVTPNTGAIPKNQHQNTSPKVTPCLPKGAGKTKSDTEKWQGIKSEPSFEDSGVVADETQTVPRTRENEETLGMKTGLVDKLPKTKENAQEPGSQTISKSYFIEELPAPPTDSTHKAAETEDNHQKQYVQQLSALSTDGGEQDDVRRQYLGQTQEQQKFNRQQQHLEPSEPPHLRMHNLTEYPNNSSSQDWSQQSQQTFSRFHSSRSKSVINQGGAGGFNVMGGNVTIRSLSVNALPRSDLSPDEGSLPSRNKNRHPVNPLIRVSAGGHLNIQSMQGQTIRLPSEGYEGDFVIIYADKDEEIAKTFKSHLEEDLPYPNVQVELFPYVDPNMSVNRSMETMLSRFGCVFIIITLNFKKDAAARATGENLQADSWRNSWKANRIVPVWTCDNKSVCPFEFSSYTGLPYYKRDWNRQIYVDCLERQLQGIRKMCLEWKRKEEEDNQ